MGASSLDGWDDPSTSVAPARESASAGRGWARVASHLGQLRSSMWIRDVLHASGSPGSSCLGRVFAEVDAEDLEMQDEKTGSEAEMSRGFLRERSMDASAVSASARRGWARLRKSTWKVKKLARWSVHEANIVGKVLKGSGAEEERVALCLQEGIKRLCLQGVPSPMDARDRRVCFELDGLSTVIEEYDGECFRQLRSAFGVEEAEFQSVLESRADDASTDMRCLTKDFASGKSESWFLVSAGMRYMLKTCTPDEGFLLLSILPSYLDHVRSVPDTLLPRFYGLYSIARGHRRASFFVMGNVFAARHPIVVRYDLKGSTHSRKASEQERCKGSSATLKDMDFLLSSDGPLVLDLGCRELESIMSVIHSDCDFLRRHKLMDYSMMIGLARCNSSSQLTYDRHVVKAVALVSAEAEAPNLVYMGIIDVLTRYTWQKRLETLMKSCLGDCSCQPPAKYAARFCNFMRHLLACPETVAAAPAGAHFQRSWVERRRHGRGDRWPPEPATRAAARPPQRAARAAARPNTQSDIELQRMPASTTLK